ncbi:hypothetical protein BJ973_002938 [Actinoplanes tereljensis]|uniref:Serine protease n=1 Tax=Paractinoplanes tereljensis TaxID=571912 RepID=A0A919NPF6_9ACTN|nr:trypsin-like peptidase domain-containing protein [Actinoplanes tereljensis]GIF22615.1 serine protease [Actinoplanes tereljensis]
MSYLAPPEFADVRTAILTVLGYDPATRAALLTGLPPSLRGLLPGGTAAPLIGLTLDLDQLNGIDRLTDGTVPLKLFLTNAVNLAGTMAEADVLRLALAEVETSASGAPRIPVADLPEIQEAIVLRDDMLPRGFFDGALTAAGGVAKLQIPRHQDGQQVLRSGQPVRFLGTGWVVAPDLLMTNHHVINARSEGEPAAGEADLRLQAGAAVVRFDYVHEDVEGVTVPVSELVGWDATLDYALLRLAPGSGRPPLTPAAGPLAPVRPDDATAVNVIQHPDGRPQLFAIRNNLLIKAAPAELQYLSDTMGGSSGSPVLDDRWRVVGLHRGSTFASGMRFQGRNVAYVNVGTPLPAILADIRQRYAAQVPELSA